MLSEIFRTRKSHLRDSYNEIKWQIHKHKVQNSDHHENMFIKF